MASTEQYENVDTTAGKGQTTLNGSILSGATSIVVHSATGFPSAAQYRIVVESEVMIVTAGAGTTTWTVTRGAEGSSAAAHGDSTTVTHVLTRDGLKGIGGSVNLDGALSGRPAAGTVGRLFFPADGLWTSRDSGTAWAGFGPSLPLTEPDDTGFSWLNQLSATTSSANGGIFLLVPATGVEGIHARVKTLPSPPYTITMGYLPMQPFADFSSVGMLLRDSGSGRIVIHSLTSNTFYQSGGGTQTRKGFVTGKWSSPTVGVADYTTTPAGVFGPDWQAGPCMWMQISDDNAGTPKLHFKISNDGVNFFEILNTTRTDYLAAADQYGFFVRNFTTSYDIGMMVASIKTA